MLDLLQPYRETFVMLVAGACFVMLCIGVSISVMASIGQSLFGEFFGGNPGVFRGQDVAALVGAPFLGLVGALAMFRRARWQRPLAVIGAAALLAVCLANGPVLGLSIGWVAFYGATGVLMLIAMMLGGGGKSDAVP